MKLNPKTTTYAAALTTGVLWIVCSALVAAFPAGIMKITGYLVHADFSQLNWSLDITGFLIGLVVWTISVSATVWIFVAFYNRLAK